MTTCTAGFGADAGTFPAGVDVFVQLALDEVAPRSHATEAIALAISRQLPPVMRPQATAGALHALRRGADPVAVLRLLQREIPYMLGYASREGQRDPADPRDDRCGGGL